jgi:hypothetical protein
MDTRQKASVVRVVRELARLWDEEASEAAYRLARAEYAVVSTDVRNWTLFAIENWTPVQVLLPQARCRAVLSRECAGGTRAPAKRPPRVWRSCGALNNQQGEPIHVKDHPLG